MKKTHKHKKLSIILPTYNEKGNVFEMYNALMEVIVDIEIDYEIIYVDDNSSDGTIELIKKLREKDKRVKYIIMSRRVGDQISLKTGLDYASGDIVVTMDSDLQHPPRYISRMIGEWEKGYDVVIAKRDKEGHNSLFKKWSEIFFYKFLNALSDTPIYYRFAGFCLLDKKVVNELNKFKEKDPFLRGMIPLVGFNISQIHYREDIRKTGTSKYTFLRMYKLAISGIVSFSVKPLYLAFYLGMIAIVISMLYGGYIIYSVLFLGDSVPGWASTILMVILLGGLQLFSLGLIGIYISKIFIQIKDRPNYIIAQSGGIDDKQKGI